MTPQDQITLGVDLAQASFDVALARPTIRPAQWRELPHLHVDGAPDSEPAMALVQRWLKEQAVDPAAVLVVAESTGQLSRRFAWCWQEATGGKVAIINPQRSHAFGQSLGVRDKTDRIDAAVLALFGLVHQPAPTRLRSRAHEELRELMRLRQSVVEQRTQWLNRRAEALGPEARKSCERQLRAAEKELKLLEARMEMLTEELIEEAPELQAQIKALVQIDGIGKVTARTLTAELGDLRLYGRGEVVAAAGLFPKRYDSGTSVWRKPRLAKGGGGRLRRVLYMGATSLFASKGPWRAVIDRLLGRGMEEMAVIGVVMRKLLLVARAVMIDGVYDPEKIGRIA